MKTVINNKKEKPDKHNKLLYLKNSKDIIKE